MKAKKKAVFIFLLLGGVLILLNDLFPADDIEKVEVGDRITEDYLHFESHREELMDINGDGKDEIILTTRFSRDAYLFIAEKDFFGYKIIWKSESLCYNYEMSCNSILGVSDYDDDGDLEIGVAFYVSLQDRFSAYLINPNTKEYELEVKDLKWDEVRIREDKLMPKNEEWRRLYRRLTPLS